MDLSTLDTPVLEQLVEDFPWFALARKELLKRRYPVVEGNELLIAREAGMFVTSRVGLINALKGNNLSDCKSAETESRTDSRAESRTEAPAIPEPEKKYYVVGGDYFMREDFKQLEKEGVKLERGIMFKPATENGAPQAGAEPPVRTANSDGDAGIITETMAKVFAQQQFNQRAIDIYKKLILLYPEKSAYFATLIEKAKKVK